MTADTIVVDVRTEQEFARGHLEGARNIDVSGNDFERQVSALSTPEAVVVYCQSGNRSAEAVTRMQNLGLEMVVDAGGVEDASKATGLRITDPAP